jgi:hypothetical protein
MALEEAEIRKIAQDIVNKSKRTAHVDTGALKRSISYTYVKEIVIFRQLFYGQFYNNSELEKNAARLMPNGTNWKIIYTNFGGQTVEVSRTRAGRKTQRSILKSLLGTSSTTNIKALIAKRKKKRKAAENGEEKD